MPGSTGPGETPARLTRRVLLRGAAVLGAGSAFSALLAACGTSSPAPTAAPAGGAAAPTSAPTTAAAAPTKAATTAATTAAPASGAAASPAAATTAPTAAATTAPAAAPKGKLLRMARNAEPFSPFVPWQIDDNPALFLSINMYDTLFHTSKDGLTVEPAVCEKYETSPDGLVWTFTLRQGVKFSDGKPLKAEDVRASLQQAVSGKKSSWKSSYKAIKEIAAPDDKTVKVILKQPYAPLLSTLAMFPAGIMPADMATASENDGFDATKTRGSGAYMLDGWKKGDPVILKRNPYYWKGAPNVEEVRIEYIPDDNARMLKLQGGEVDVVDFVPLSQLQNLNTQPNIAAQAFTIQQFAVLAMNVEKKPLDDVKIRQALNYALDKEAIIKTVYFGQAKFMNSPIPPGTYWDKNLPGYPFNLEKAKQLMAASSSPNGFTLEYSIASGNTVQQQIATIAKDQWSKIGVTVNIQQLETSVLRQSFREGKLSIFQGGWTNDMNDPTEIVNYAMRGGASPFAYWTRYNNPAVNELIDKADLNQDPKQREQQYAQLQKMYLDDAPMVFLVYPPATAAWQKYVEGFFIDGLSYYRFENVKVNK